MTTTKNHTNNTTKKTNTDTMAYTSSNAIATPKIETTINNQSNTNTQ